MTRKISKQSELPSWYKLTNYNQLSDLEAPYWYWHLAARIYLFTHFAEIGIPSGEANRDTKIRSSYPREHELLELIRESPASKEVAQHIKAKFGDSIVLTDVAVKHASLADIEEYSRHHPAALDFAPAAVSHPSIARSNITLIRVDLAKPERVLIEGMTSLIKQAKVELGINSDDRFRMPNLSDWARLGVLQLFDLKIWELEADCSIPNRVFADAIFSGEEEGEETVRKTSSKILKEILDGDLMTKLATLSSD